MKIRAVLCNYNINDLIVNNETRMRKLKNKIVQEKGQEVTKLHHLFVLYNI